MQRLLVSHNAEAPSEWRVELRIGISLGDVIVDGADLYGNGVNVAARLEALAEPGTICVSANVRDQVVATGQFAFESVGRQNVKNIDQPIEVFRLSPAAGSTTLAASQAGPKDYRRYLLPITLGGLALGAIALAGLPWRPWASAVPTASLERMAFPLPEKPSVAVLPFENLSGDPAQGYLADGISEAITTTLSRIPNMFVIDRMSAFAFKSRSTTVQQVAEALGVRYVLEGSLQRSASRLRVTSRLLDALTGGHLWAGQYDGDLKEIFDFQDGIARAVVTALQVELIDGEQARVWRDQTDSTEAYEHYLRGLDQWRQLTREGNFQARQLFERAVLLDPRFAAAWVELARTYYLAARFSWTEDTGASITLARELAERALQIDADQADTYAMLSNVAILQRNYEDTSAYCEKAISVRPNSEAMAHCARNLSFVDRPDQALALIKQAMRLSPYYPGWYLCTLGTAQRVLGNYDEAVTALESCRRRLPESPVIDAGLAAAYGLAGHQEAARSLVSDLMKRSPRYSLRQFAASQFYRDQKESERLIAALRAAGLPDE